MSERQFVLHSVSEGGYWNNADGWVLDEPGADRFPESSLAHLHLPRATAGDAQWQEAQPIMEQRIPISRIVIDNIEGDGELHKFVGERALEAADAYAAHAERPTIGYYKTDATVTWEDGSVFTFRFDLESSERNRFSDSLSQTVRLHAGDLRPEAFSPEEYQAFLTTYYGTDADRWRRCAAICFEFQIGHSLAIDPAGTRALRKQGLLALVERNVRHGKALRL